MLKKLLDDIARAKVLVVGDTMLDRYWYGDVERISPEAPVPVVSIQKEDERLGGAANVARSVRALGAQCELLSVSGNDAAATTLETLLAEHGIGSKLHKDKTMKTTVKLRVIAHKQQVVRLDFESASTGKQRDNLLASYKDAISDCDVVIISDYNKGGLGHIKKMIEIARSKNKPVIVDPKGDDYSNYVYADLVTPNRKEFELVAGRFSDDSEMESKARTLIAGLHVGRLLVTRGEQGMSLMHPSETSLHIGARKREVYDVTGAGDTVIAAMGCAYAVKADMEQAIQLANIAAGIVVDKLGAATASAAEILGDISGQGE